jgi:hypothetical protein
MVEKVKHPRCDARAAGTGARCALPEGHAAPHTAAGGEWPSEASQALFDLRVMQLKLRDMAEHLTVDAMVPEAAHDPTELLRWFEEKFPEAFPNAKQQMQKQALKLVKNAV